MALTRETCASSAVRTERERTTITRCRIRGGGLAPIRETFRKRARGAICPREVATIRRILLPVTWDRGRRRIGDNRDEHVNPTPQSPIKVGFVIRGGTVERLWATHRNDAFYRLENAPAFAFGVSLHDVVEVVRDDGGNYWAMRVVERGPFATIRVVLDEFLPRGLRLTRTIDANGCSFEKMNACLFAVFGADANMRQLISQLARDGYRWEYVNPKREDVPSPESSAAVDRLTAREVDAAKQALIHLEPPWKDRADDEIEVIVEIEPGRSRSELLPARRIDDHRWQLCSSPFLAENLALGDIVEADTSLVMTRRASRSGRAAISVFVADTARVDGVKASLERIGCVVERRTRTGSLAVDCATTETFSNAEVWLLAQENIVFDVLQAPRRADDRSTD